MPGKVTAEILTDILCVWAYGAQAQIGWLKQYFGGKIELRYRLARRFPMTHLQIVE